MIVHSSKNPIILNEAKIIDKNWNKLSEEEKWKIISAENEEEKKTGKSNIIKNYLRESGNHNYKYKGFIIVFPLKEEMELDPDFTRFGDIKELDIIKDVIDKEGENYKRNIKNILKKENVTGNILDYYYIDYESQGPDEIFVLMKDNKDYKEVEIRNWDDDKDIYIKMIRKTNKI